jgi:hypothetical protein
MMESAVEESSAALYVWHGMGGMDDGGMDGKR